MRVSNRLWHVLTMAAALLLPCRVSAQSNNAFGQLETFFGRVDFITTGASLTDAGNLPNGVQCLLDSASVEVPAFGADERPELVAAYLYWSGSLIGDDFDFQPPQASLFATNGRADNEADLPGILQSALAAADRQVELTLPGQSQSHTITADDDGLYVHAYYKSAGQELGNVAFFLARADITELLLEQGTALTGTYSVGELTADVCLDLEARCSEGHTCTSLSNVHTNGNASFALVLVVQDPSWRLRKVTLFDGLYGLDNKSIPITLSEGILVSDPPDGKLSYYVLEGDRSIYNTSEFITVDGGSQVLELTDDDNTDGNPFNGTINTVHYDPPLQQCVDLGLGDGQCGVAGVDIDVFDIQQSLAVDAEQIDITLSTASDRIILAGVNVGVSVFSPILELDSRILTLDENTDGMPALAPVSYLVALSNTGNLPSYEASLIIHVPRYTTSFSVEGLPPGAVNQTSQTGGDFGKGIIDIRSIQVDPGKVADVRIVLTPSCSARLVDFNFDARVTYEAGQFEMSAPVVKIIDDVDGTCPPLDDDGSTDLPFWMTMGLLLEGGGGCQAVSAGAGGLWLLLLLPLGLLLTIARRRKG